MGQTGTIFFALLVGFLVFITLKQELGAYIGTMFGPGGAAVAETTEQKAKRLASELANLKKEASRINDSLKPIPGA